MKRRIPFLQKPVWGVSILMCSVAFVTMGAHAEPLVINPFPEQQNATPPALESEPAVEAVKEDAVKKQEPVSVAPQAELEDPAVLGTPEAISARPHPEVKEPANAPKPYYEFEPAEEAAAAPKSEPAAIEDAPSPLEITTPDSVAVPEPVQSVSRELPPGVKVPEPGSSYFDAPAGTVPAAPIAEKIPVAAPESAKPQPRYITEVPAKEPVSAAADNVAPSAVPEQDIAIQSAGNAQDVNDAFEGGGIVVKSSSGRASDKEIRRLAEQNQMPTEEELNTMRPLESAPPPPQRMRMSDQLQAQANALVDENPMPRAADAAPVASAEPLSVSLQDIGEKPVDPAEPLTQQNDGPYVPYMAQKERGYVPQDEELRREFEEIAPLPPQNKLRSPEPILSEPVQQAQSLAEPVPENVTRYDAPAEPPLIEPREVAPVSAQAPVNEVVTQAAASAAPEMQKPGLVYIRDGEVLDPHEPINAPEVREPVMGEELVATQPSEDIRWESARPQNSPAMNSAGMSGRWIADEGMSVRQVLTDWCGRSGVRLIWDNAGDFTVKNAVSIEGAYEAAVQSLLDQYQNDNARPLATLHLDQNSGERALVVKVASGS